MTTDELKKVLSDHALWLKLAGGKCADLTGADLTCAALRGAVLRGAVLRGSALRGSVLTGADLTDADLRGAALRGADLTDADLTGADLTGADLTGADLTDADLTRADLRRADLTGAALRGADLTGAALRGADLTGVPHVPDLDRQILSRIESGGVLKMDYWHTCETTHCRAGWAIVVSPGGVDLENMIGTPAAAALIYARAYPELPIPDFYAPNEDALRDIKTRAAINQD